MNRTSGRWYNPYFTNYGFSSKETSVYSFSTSFFLHNSVALLYCYRISHSCIILSGWFHIKIDIATINLTICVPRVVHYPLIKIFFSPLQSDSDVNSDPHKQLLRFTIYHLAAASSPKNLCLDFSSGDTVDLEMK